MSKKTNEFDVPAETITEGGSYLVDPVARTVTRVAFTSFEPQLEAAQETQAQSKE